MFFFAVFSLFRYAPIYIINFNCFFAVFSLFIYVCSNIHLSMFFAVFSLFMYVCPNYTLLLGRGWGTAYAHNKGYNACDKSARARAYVSESRNVLVTMFTRRLTAVIYTIQIRTLGARPAVRIARTLCSRQYRAHLPPSTWPRPPLHLSVGLFLYAKWYTGLHALCHDSQVSLAFSGEATMKKTKYQHLSSNSCWRLREHWERASMKMLERHITMLWRDWALLSRLVHRLM